MFEKNFNLEGNAHDTDLSVDRILENAYQRSGGTKGIKGPKQDEPIEELTK